jgi:hypothetical protein
MNIFVYADHVGLRAFADAVAPHLGRLGTVEALDTGSLFTLGSPLTRSRPEKADFFLVPLSLRLSDVFVWRTLFGMSGAACAQALHDIDAALSAVLPLLQHFDRGTHTRHIFFQLGDLIQALPVLSQSVLFHESASLQNLAIPYPYYPYDHARPSRPILDCSITLSFRGNTQYPEVRRHLERAMRSIERQGYRCHYESMDRLVVRNPADRAVAHLSCIQDALEDFISALQREGYRCDLDDTPVDSIVSHGTSWEISALPSLRGSGTEALQILREHGYRVFYEIARDASGISYRKEYERLLDDSRFILCPRGVALNSIRFFEALAWGRVPVLLADDTRLPLEWEIDYERFVVRVPEREVYDIPRYIETFLRHHDLTEASRQAQAVFTTYFQRNSQGLFLYRCLRHVQGQRG